VLQAAREPAARRDHLLIALMLATGIRVGSALALDVEDVDLGAGELSLRKAKGDSERVYLARDVRSHLAEYLEHAPKTGPLLRGPSGERLSVRQAQKRISAALERAAIRNATPHSLRHSFAARLLDRTGDLFW
jgi:integrase